ncbi:MAG TPA: UbiA family prenyltransferase [Pirellulales bacterium]
MSTEAVDPRTTIRGYLELLRLPNVFTAITDVLMGYLLTHPSVDNPQLLGFILLGSACLYLAGMVLNDVFDYQVDLAERPTRPLPAGLVPMRTAAGLGYVLLAAGLALGWSAAAAAHTLRTGIVVTLLALAVWLYDRVLKRTPLGPLSMGSCRFLNVLLGMSPGAMPWLTSDWVVAGGIGTYITGVTWFARREAGNSRRWHLLLATLVMGCGLGLLCWFPWSVELPEQLLRAPYALGLGSNWILLWLLIGLSIGFRCQQAIVHPVKLRVQIAIKHALVSLIVIDAAVCFAAQGQNLWTFGILLLLVPTVFIGRWIYST